MELNLHPKKVARFFAWIVAFLTLAQIVGLFSTYVLGYDNIFGLIPLFSLNREQNIPALYSTLTLFLCAVLLAFIAYAKKKRKEPFFFHWGGLSAIFLLLMMDENLSFHEQLTRPLQKKLHTSGVLYYAWIIPYGIALLIIVLVYLKFVFHLPRRTRFLLILAGLIFVSGAMGMELPGGVRDQAVGRHNLLYAIYSTIEEVLEMTGIVILIYTLIAYIGSMFQDVHISLSADSASEVLLRHD